MRSVARIGGLAIVATFALDAVAQTKVPSRIDIKSAPPPGKAVDTQMLTASGAVRPQFGAPREGEQATRDLSAAVTFFVPIRVYRVTSALTQIRVFCNVKNTDLSTAPPTSTVGTGSSVTKALGGGTWNGTLAVPVNPLPGRRADEMKAYRCDLQFAGADGKWDYIGTGRYPALMADLKTATLGLIR